MEQSILFIKILALYFIISGVFLLLKGKTLPILLKDFFNHPNIVYLTGIILVLLGGVILIQNNVSILNRTTQIITAVFGWLVLFKGLAYMFIPKIITKISLKKFNSWFGVFGVIMMTFGIYLFFIIS